MPLPDDLLAEHGAVGQPFQEQYQLLGVIGRGDGPKALGIVRGTIQVNGHRRRERRDALDGTRESLLRHGPARMAGRGQLVDAADELQDLARGEGLPVLHDAALVDANHPFHGDTCPVEQPADVGQDRRGSIVARQPVHDHDEWQPTLCHASQHVPRHPVGVARGGRDEQAQVRQFQDGVGQGSVVVLDRIDIGGVDEHYPGSGADIGDLQPVAGEGRQRTVRAEQGGSVRGCGHDHGLTSGRPEDARLAHGGTGEGVDDGRLARPRGSQEHHHQRRVEVPGPGHEVVASVVEQLPGALPWPDGVGGADRLIGVPAQ
jgi:hypothetical protein